MPSACRRRATDTKTKTGNGSLPTCSSLDQPRCACPSVARVCVCAWLLLSIGRRKQASPCRVKVLLLKYPKVLKAVSLTCCSHSQLSQLQSAAHHSLVTLSVSTSAAFPFPIYISSWFGASVASQFSISKRSYHGFLVCILFQKFSNWKKKKQLKLWQNFVWHLLP